MELISLGGTEVNIGDTIFLQDLSCLGAAMVDCRDIRQPRLDLGVGVAVTQKPGNETEDRHPPREADKRPGTNRSGTAYGVLR